MSSPERQYRYLDGEAERQELVEAIRQVRRSVIQFAEATPEERRYEPRYHGWSLAAMLAHLHLTDRLAMWSIDLALLGLRPHVSLATLNSFNDRMAHVFRNRRVETTVRGIQRYERQITDFIVRLPMAQFSKSVFYPPDQETLTVERALQAYYLYHWQEHLATMQRGEGIYYEPPEQRDTL